jgi:hypothetical protein
MPQPLYDNPWFMDQVYAYGKDQSNPIPDPSLLERDPSDIMRIMDAMLGPGGYMKFLRDFKDKTKKKGERPDTGVDDVTAGMNVIKKGTPKRDPMGEADRIINGY